MERLATQERTEAWLNQPVAQVPDPANRSEAGDGVDGGGQASDEPFRLNMFVYSSTEGRTSAFKVTPSVTIAEMKKRYAKKFYKPMLTLCKFKFNGVTLENAKTLGDYGIGHDSTVECDEDDVGDPQDSPDFSVTVESLAGETITIDGVLNTDPVVVLKDKIRMVRHLANKVDVRLIYNDVELEDGRFLKYYGINSETQLTMVLESKERQQDPRYEPSDSEDEQAEDETIYVHLPDDTYLTFISKEVEQNEYPCYTDDLLDFIEDKTGFDMKKYRVTMVYSTVGKSLQSGMEIVHGFRIHACGIGHGTVLLVSTREEEEESEGGSEESWDTQENRKEEFMRLIEEENRLELLIHVLPGVHLGADFSRHDDVRTVRERFSRIFPRFYSPVLDFYYNGVLLDKDKNLTLSDYGVVDGATLNFGKSG
jgi:hypothetical protein